MSMHEYEWRMNKDELNDGWVYMNMNGGWMKKTKGWMSMHEYERRMNKEELKDGWIWMEDE